ncbi:MAG: quinone oxidoreductase [Omnitrophica WOR_2 bacterium RIFCSPHIGHO2_02_FULL_50_17]|nr:MAG: quinone oxidoreductase [Omnitrophica WOR_2 bacterium RIFCSPHIGHO2_02_FULL_50_17]
MKAVRVERFGGPEVMAISEVPALVSSSHQAVVEVKAAGVNPVDTYIRSGNYPVNLSLPYTPGIDGAGIVKAVGRGAGGIRVGDRVYIAESISGTYAQEALCAQDQIYPLPPNLDFNQGAGIYVPYTTAYEALFLKADPQKGETLLVHGASGGVGIAAVQLAVAFGLRVLGTAGSLEGRELVIQQGAQHVYDHHAPDYREAILKDTDGQGVDVILEMLANVNLGEDLKLLAHGGRVVVIGSRGTVEINPRDLMARDARIFAAAVLRISLEEKTRIQDRLREGFEKGELTPIIGAVLPLQEAPQAHRQIMERPAYGKIVLMP